MLKSEIKAGHLVEKGMEILWAKGYNGTSVNDIVKAAGVPKGSFYFYFESKEDFAVKAIEAYFEAQYPRALKILQKQELSPRQRLLDFYEYRCTILKEEFNCKMGCLACNIGNEMAEYSEKIRQIIIMKESILKADITKTVKEAQELGEISKSISAEDIVAFFEDAGKGAMISMKEMKDCYPIDNLMNMFRFFLTK